MIQNQRAVYVAIVLGCFIVFFVRRNDRVFFLAFFFTSGKMVRTLLFDWMYTMFDVVAPVLWSAFELTPTNLESLISYTVYDLLYMSQLRFPSCRPDWRAITNPCYRYWLYNCCHSGRWYLSPNFAYLVYCGVHHLAQVWSAHVIWESMCTSKFLIFVTLREP